jgi:hypothetical protein
MPRFGVASDVARLAATYQTDGKARVFKFPIGVQFRKAFFCQEDCFSEFFGTVSVNVSRRSAMPAGKRSSTPWSTHLYMNVGCWDGMYGESKLIYRIRLAASGLAPKQLYSR